MDFNLLLNKSQTLLFDGSMGAQLMMRGLEPGKLPDLWNIEKPRIITDLLSQYYNFGSDLVQTATFQANGVALEKLGLRNEMETINSASGEILKSICPKGKCIIGDIGPSGEFLPPIGNCTINKMEEGFSEQAQILDRYVDAWHLETFSDLKEINSAIRGVKRISKKPIIASMTYKKSPKGFYTVMGNSLSQSIDNLIANEISVIGANCTLGSNDYIELTKTMRDIITDFPISIKPNAGQPTLEDGKTVYKQSPEEFAKDFKEILRYNVQIIGGCCGTGPEHVKLLRTLIDATSW